MTQKKRFLLRLDRRLHAALERWAADELRSVNAQIVYLLTESARRHGRLKRSDDDPFRGEGRGEVLEYDDDDGGDA